VLARHALTVLVSREYEHLLLALEVGRSVCAVHAVRPATGEILGSLGWPYGDQIFAVERCRPRFP